MDICTDTVKTGSCSIKWVTGLQTNKKIVPRGEISVNWNNG